MKFIRQFREDYSAGVQHLVENYRSTRHIIAAANQLIDNNRDRMKTDRAIRIDRGREAQPAGGDWSGRDPVAAGRVQLLLVNDAFSQARALVAELQRLRSLKPDLQWTDCAVLARTRETLDPIRALLEHHGIPLIRTLDRDKTPPLHRIREIARFLDLLKSRREEFLCGSDLQALLVELSGAGSENPWYELLRDLLAAWSEETGGCRTTGSPGHRIPLRGAGGTEARTGHWARSLSRHRARRQRHGV